MNNFYFFQKPEERIEFLNIFNKIQRTYHVLNKLCLLYKIKKSKIVVNTDLQLNEINIKQKNVISIYHNNNIYLFKIQELLKIIYTSLTNSHMFFSEPITIKNPYNNLPFGKSILYHIYFYLTQNTLIGCINHEYTDLFFKFKQSNFNMTKFVDNYEHILRELSFQNYINNSTKEQLKLEILNMIAGYNLKFPNNIISINRDFPTNFLIDAMKPYFKLYLIAAFSIVPKNKNEAKKKLHRKLKEFQLFNPSFGRKMIILKDKIVNGKFVKYKAGTSFNFEYKKFNTNSIENFMTNHLNYKYNSDNIDNEDYDNDETRLSFNIFFIQNEISNENDSDIDNTEDEEDYEEEYDEDSIS